MAKEDGSNPPSRKRSELICMRVEEGVSEGRLLKAEAGQGDCWVGRGGTGGSPRNLYFVWYNGKTVEHYKTSSEKSIILQLCTSI